MTSQWHSELEILFRLLVGALLGGVVGWEREHRGRGAGLRTNMLVALSAALFTSTGDLLETHFAHYGTLIQGNPIGVLRAVVLGVSFLGSGIIFVSRHQDRVLGITTAATVWAVTGIGIVVGLEQYLLACGATALVFVILHVVALFEPSEAEKSRIDDES